MKILTRSEFEQWMVREFDDPAIVATKSALWIPEDRPGLKCQHFVFGSTDRAGKEEYWQWCTSVLKGYVRCFWANSDTGEEWWGFTEQEDIPIWILKWTT